MSTVETLTTAVLERGSAVRFETQCVVIPDHVYRSPRLPRVVTKSYALPLWRRRSSSAGPSNTCSAPQQDHHPSLEEDQSHLVLRLPLPTLSLKSPPLARPPDHHPLPPCLVHRSQPSGSGSTSTSPTQTRHTRNPLKTYHSPSRSDIITVPLRPCCTACQPVTEAAFVNGDAWQEHFSRAASRRRSMSADSGPRTITVSGSAASASYGDLGVSINVDEVDKRRRSSDGGPCTTQGQVAPWFDDAKPREEVSLTGRCSGAANSASADAHVPPSPTPAPPRIPEEDDNEDDSELFPLPSPKRTPGSSPAASPAGSLSSLAVAHGSQNCSTCSEDCHNHGNKRSDLLAPPPSCPSSSSLSFPRVCDSTTNLSEDSHRAPPSPSILSALPSLSNRHRSRSPSPLCALDQPSPMDALSPATKDGLPESSPEPVPTPVPITIMSRREPSQSPSLISVHHSPLSARLPWRSKRSVSADVGSTAGSPPFLSSSSPSMSPPSSFSLSGAKKTFGITNTGHVIADVLRGVGAVASSGMGPGI